MRAFAHLPFDCIEAQAGLAIGADNVILFSSSGDGEDIPKIGICNGIAIRARPLQCRGQICDAMPC